MSSTLIDSGNNFSLLDALIALSQSVRLLVIGPIVVAVAVVCLLFVLPSRFESKVIFLPSAIALGGSQTAWQAAAVMKSVVVLDEVLVALSPGSGRPDDEARVALAASIKTNVLKDGLLHVDVSGATALEAQKS
jgi:hypothetical protein